MLSWFSLFAYAKNVYFISTHISYSRLNSKVYIYNIYIKQSQFFFKNNLGTVLLLFFNSCDRLSWILVYNLGTEDQQLVKISIVLFKKKICGSLTFKIFDTHLQILRQQ